LNCEQNGKQNKQNENGFSSSVGKTKKKHYQITMDDDRDDDARHNGDSTQKEMNGEQS